MRAPFNLDFDALNDHAKKVDQAAGDVAVSAAGVGGLSGDAFGALGGFLVASVDSVCGTLRHSCASAELLAESRVLASRVASGDWIPGGAGAIPAPSGSGADVERTLASLTQGRQIETRGAGAIQGR